MQVGDARLEMALAAPERLRHRAPQRPREEESGDRHQHERGAPGDDARDRAADDEAGRCASDLAGEDVGVDPAALAGRKVVAGQRRDRRAGGGARRAERETSQQQRSVAAGEGARERGYAPEDDAGRQQRDPLDAIDEHSDGRDEYSSDQQGDGAEQADLGEVDVQRLHELRCDRADGRGVGGGEREHSAEQPDHARPCGTANVLDDTTLDDAARFTDCAKRGAPGGARRLAAAHRSHASIAQNHGAQRLVARAVRWSAANATLADAVAGEAQLQIVRLRGVAQGVIEPRCRPSARRHRAPGRTSACRSTRPVRERRPGPLRARGCE
jgi:hypothetical protein